MTMQLGLGSAQFGMDYGVANTEGKALEDDVRDILILAAARNVSIIDTAAAYGDAEAVLGRCLAGNSRFRIVTKSRPLSDCLNASDAKRWASEGLTRSLDHLRLDAVDGLLVHHVADLLGPFGDDLYADMLSLKQSGKVRTIGFSAYNGVEIDAALNRYEIDLVQIPVNVLDQRLIEGGQLLRLRKRGVEVHIRSVFLQGLLLIDPLSMPAYFEPIRPGLVAWRQQLDELGLTPAQGALAFVRSLDAAVALVGVMSPAQLATNIVNFSAEMTSEIDYVKFALRDEQFINPSFWKI